MELCSSVWALQHRPTPTSEVVAQLLVVARLWLPNIVPPGRAEVVTSGGDVGKDKPPQVNPV